MAFPRRTFFRFAAGAAALMAASRAASALDYPARPIRLVVGFPPGGGYDITARLLGQWLSERLGQPIIIENRPGAATNLATEMVVRAPADGYTLLLLGLSNAINATLYDKLNFNFIRDIVPVAGILRAPLVMVVDPSVPAKTIPAFIAYAKSNAGKISMASAGNGSAPHIAGELFKMMAGVDLIHVPYRGGGPAMTDLLGARVQVFFSPISVAIPHMKSGTIRPLGVTTATRLELFPDIPTVGENLPGYEVSGWEGIGAPKNTPAEIVDKLNKHVTAALADPKVKAHLAELGNIVLGGSPADLGTMIAVETERWSKVIRAAKIKVE